MNTLNLAAALFLSSLALGSQPITTAKMKPAPGALQQAEPVAKDFLEDFVQRDVDALAEHMIAETTIFVEKMWTGPETMSVADFLDTPDAVWSELDARLMTTSLLTGRKLARGWAIYRAQSDGEVMHCGAIAIGLAETHEGWKVVNVGLAMVPLQECPELSASEERE